MKLLLIYAKVLLLVSGLLTSACTSTGDRNTSASASEPDVLIIYPDGSMRLKNRMIPREDVVIYPDGFGGERAAVKMWRVPFHPPFYRDSIVVERLEDLQVVDK